MGITSEGTLWFAKAFFMLPSGLRLGVPFDSRFQHVTYVISHYVKVVQGRHKNMRSPGTINGLKGLVSSYF
jgi:hypothetical protein